MSIRQTLTLAAGIMGAAALVASGWLSVLTTRLNRESQGLQVAVEGRHSAERIESDLLLLDRAEDAAIRAVLARNLRQALAAASGDAMTAAQAEALRGAKAAVGRYLELFESAADSRDRKSSLHEAYSALEDLVRVNEDLWRAGLEQIGLWDRLADRLAISIVAFALITVVACAWYLTVRVFRPLLALAAAIERFGRGELAVRAEERDPTELRNIAVRFNTMADTLVRQRKARVAFLAGVAHDQRGPLGSIAMCLETLRLGIELSPDKRREVLQRATRQVAFLDRMTADFIDAARVESGEFELRRERLDARTIAERSTDMFTGASPHHCLELSLPERPVWLTGDPLRLEQVLINLISNAIKYLPTGAASA